MTNMITVSNVSQILIEQGFVEQDQVPHFGEVNKHCWYGMRHKNDEYQYILLVGFYEDNRFLEAVCELYLSPKNTRTPKLNFPKPPALAGYIKDLQRKGFWPVKICLVRTIEELCQFNS